LFTKPECTVKHLLFSSLLPGSLVLALFFLPLASEAHPGVGIVCDARGNIFYTDLKNVYRIGTDGRESIAVAGVHTHELALDSAGNLYGEHLWYTGERDNRWRRYVWQYRPEGTTVRLLDEHEAFRSGNFGFVRDAAFHSYRAYRDGQEFVFEKTGPGVIGRRALRDVQWLKAGPGGTLYFAENDNLWRLDSTGRFDLLAEKLAEPTHPFADFGANRSIFGIWFDASGNVYTALHTSGLIKKISPGGAVTTVCKSPPGWSPVGGVFDRDGHLWVLESTFTSAMRTRKVEAAEVCRGAIPDDTAAWWGGAVLLILLAGWGIRRLW
jgi:hypothetical protein